MKKPQSVPVEQARKEFADLLDGTQHKGEFVEITRRGRSASVMVPPEWFEVAVAAISENKELKKRLAAE
jgi:prevent-host-death family protein